MGRWQEKEYNRNKIIENAVQAADKIIMDGSDGSEEETNYFTAMVAQKFMEKALRPLQTAIQKKDFLDEHRQKTN